jgi:hypothetical protein
MAASSRGFCNNIGRRGKRLRGAGPNHVERAGRFSTSSGRCHHGSSHGNERQLRGRRRAANKCKWRMRTLPNGPSTSDGRASERKCSHSGAWHSIYMGSAKDAYERFKHHDRERGECTGLRALVPQLVPAMSPSAQSAQRAGRSLQPGVPTRASLTTPPIQGGPYARCAQSAEHEIDQCPCGKG